MKTQATTRAFGVGNEWRLQARCRGMDPVLADALFFPVGTRDRLKSEREALCFSCPVREECEEYGNNTGDDVAAWGGYTREERRKRRRNVGYQRFSDGIA